MDLIVWALIVGAPLAILIWVLNYRREDSGHATVGKPLVKPGINFDGPPPYAAARSAADTPAPARSTGFDQPPRSAVVREAVDSFTPAEFTLTTMLGAHAWIALRMDRPAALEAAVAQVNAIKKKVVSMDSIAIMNAWIESNPTTAERACREFYEWAEGVGARGEPGYVEDIIKYELNREDMTALSMLTAFAWKHVGFPPARATEHAMQMIYLSRSGSIRQQRDAKAAWESAVRWSLDVGLSANVWGQQCIALVRAGSSRARSSKS